MENGGEILRDLFIESAEDSKLKFTVKHYRPCKSTRVRYKNRMVSAMNILHTSSRFAVARGNGAVRAARATARQYFTLTIFPL